jgi:hypothetical protein
MGAMRLWVRRCEVVDVFEVFNGKLVMVVWEFCVSE